MSDFNYRDGKILLLKLGSELQNLVKKLQSAVKVYTKYRQNLEEVKNFHEKECTRG